MLTHNPPVFADTASLAYDGLTVDTLGELSRLLRRLRRREARRRGGSELTYRELASLTGWSHGVIGEYFVGAALPPVDRFEVLIALLGASEAERQALASARDRVEDARRGIRIPPAEEPSFPGRVTELAALAQILTYDEDAFALPIAVLSGPVGVGKTALARHWARTADAAYPDGQFFVDLCGDRPRPPGDVLARLLRALGMSPEMIPDDDVERAARLRTMLAGRRMLLVLDNAHDGEQVRPLLPGEPGCHVLVTSRNGLTDLVVVNGARRILLQPVEVGAQPRSVTWSGSTQRRRAFPAWSSTVISAAPASTATEASR